jgi:alanyl-tRNA synthetase
LLQSALKQVIGQETSQAGSLVAFDRLRFDFNFHQPITDSELEEIERLVNRWIGDATLLQTKVMPLADAKGAGAIAMFGEKYGEEVECSVKFDNCCILYCFISNSESALHLVLIT